MEHENPKLEYILVMASGINHIDSSAVEMLRSLTRHLRECGITLVFSGAKRQFLEVAERTDLIAEIKRDNLFSSDDLAMKALITRIDAHANQT
jgi:SulP family sulfate permease